MSAPTRKPAARKVRRVSATELSRHLSRVLSRVHDRSETVIVERNGKPLCQLMPVERDKTEFTVGDLVELLRSLPPAGKAWADAVAEHVENQETYKAPKWSR